MSFTDTIEINLVSESSFHNHYFITIISRLADLGESLKILVTSGNSSTGCCVEITKELQHTVVVKEVGGGGGWDLNPVWHRDQVGVRKL